MVEHDKENGNPAQTFDVGAPGEGRGRVGDAASFLKACERRSTTLAQSFAKDVERRYKRARATSQGRNELSVQKSRGSTLRETSSLNLPLFQYLIAFANILLFRQSGYFVVLGYFLVEVT